VKSSKKIEKHRKKLIKNNKTLSKKKAVELQLQAKGENDETERKKKAKFKSSTEESDNQPS